MKNNNTKTLLKNVCNISKGKGLKHEKVNFTEGQNCILCGDLFTQYDTVIKNVVHKTTYNEGVSSKKNTVLIPGDTTTNAWDIAKAVALDEEKVLLGGSINILEFDEQCDNTFFAYYLSSKKRKDLAKLAIGSTVVHLHGKEIGNVEVSYPSKEIQVKIGSFFKELDELIELTNEAINHYETLRKGIRQTIFAGEKIQINKLVSIRKGKQLNKNDFDNDGPYPVYNGAKKEIGYHSQYNEEGPKIIINEGGSSGTVFLVKTNFWASGHSYVLDIIEDIDINILYETLKKEEPKLKNMAYGSGIPSVKAIDILNHYINLPIIPHNKALEIFENINSIIEELQAKVVYLEKTKKHYLNKIFK